MENKALLILEPKIFEYIRTAFNNQAEIKEKRPGIFQLYLPIFHEDGDMVELFIVPTGKDKYKLCDFGHTLMRLSYSYEIDTPNKEAIFQRILNENFLKEEDGNISFETQTGTVFTDIMHITQALAKIGSMRYFKREVIASLFFEMLDEVIFKNLLEFKPQKNVFPLVGHEEIAADYQFTPNGHPVYLFGINDTTKARLATITCLTLQRAKVHFRSMAVYEDFDALPKKDRQRLTNSCDKQFTSLDEFAQTGKEFLEREKSL